jgi:hypothetical protein
MAATGWVPFVNDKTQMAIDPGGGRQPNLPDDSERSFLEQTALYLLFLSGNPTDNPATNPNPETLDEQGFRRLSETNNFRALLGLKNIRVYWDENADPVSVSYEFLPVMGYTLLRLPGTSLVVGALQGISEAAPAPTDEIWDLGFSFPSVNAEVHSQGSAVSLTLRYRFMLSRLPDLLGHALTGNWAPWAWFEIAIVVAGTTELANVAFSGTAIPSQSAYAEGRRLEGSPYNMAQGSRFRIGGFYERRQTKGRPGTAGIQGRGMVDKASVIVWKNKSRVYAIDRRHHEDPGLQRFRSGFRPSNDGLAARRAGSGPD